MLDLGWQELFFITLIAIIVVGPKDLPLVIRSLSRWVFQTKNIVKNVLKDIVELAVFKTSGQFTYWIDVFAQQTFLKNTHLHLLLKSDRPHLYLQKQQCGRLLSVQTFLK